MTTSKGFWASLLIFPLVIALLSSSPLTAATNDDPAEPLEKCLEENQSSSWLFLIDASKSLQENDPKGQRADALKTAIRELHSGSKENSIQIAFLEFGTKTLSDKVRWKRLDDSSKVLLEEEAASFKTKNTQKDTDYLGALKGAMDVLDKAEDRSCKVLLWFSDGELSLEAGFAARSETTDLPKNWEPIRFGSEEFGEKKNP